MVNPGSLVLTHRHIGHVPVHSSLIIVYTCRLLQMSSCDPGCSREQPRTEACQPLEHTATGDYRSLADQPLQLDNNMRIERLAVPIRLFGPFEVWIGFYHAGSFCRVVYTFEQGSKVNRQVNATFLQADVFPTQSMSPQLSVWTSSVGGPSWFFNVWASWISDSSWSSKWMCRHQRLPHSAGKEPFQFSNMDTVWYTAS